MPRSVKLIFKTIFLFDWILPNFLGVCYSYDMNSKRYDASSDNFQWDWTSSKVKFYDSRNVIKTFNSFSKRSRKWDIIGFMGSNVLFNEDGVVFSTPFARSYGIGYGGESGTIVLRKDNDDEFIIANGKWKKDSTDYLQNLAGSAIAKGNFYTGSR